MKFLIYIFLFLFVKVSFAQENMSAKNEVLPEFPGGINEMLSFISKNLNYPTYAKNKKIIGNIDLKFVVDTNGNVSNAEVTKSSGDTIFDEAAIKAIYKMPKWKPGSKNNELIPVTYYLPIIFDINKKGAITEKKLLFARDETRVISAPVFRGGTEEMMKFINENKVYPKAIKDSGIVGETIIKFLIDSIGKVCIPSVRQSSGNSKLDKEALKLVASMPNWIPAYKNGNRINQYCDLAIQFGKKAKVDEVKKNQHNLSNKYFNDGMIAFQTDNISLAKEKYKKAYQLNCYHSDALYNLGISYFKLNQKDSACVCWSDFKINFAKQEADELIKKYCSN